MKESTKATLGIDAFIMQSEVNSIRNYINDTEKDIIRRQEELSVKLKEVESKGDYDSDLHVKNQDYLFYPILFYNSTLISLYSLFESRLKQICIYFQKMEGYSLSITDLYGDDYIEKSKKYLTKVVGIVINDLEVDWNNIRNYQKVRNLIAHNNSNIIREPSKKVQEQKHYQEIANSQYLDLDEISGFIRIKNKDYLINFCDLIERYMYNIVKSIQ